MRASSTADFVIGFNRLGGVGQIVQALWRRRGRNICVLHNDPPMLPASVTLVLDRVRGQGGKVSVECLDVLSSEAQFAALADSPLLDESSCVICMTDAALLPFAYQWERLALKRAISNRVSASGIVRARLKPVARSVWQNSGVDPTSWRVNEVNESGEILTVCDGGLDLRDDGTYVVKPIAGSASRLVKSCSGALLSVTIRHVVEQLKSAEARRTRYAALPNADLCLETMVLVEECLEGVEYTVDGLIDGAFACGVVQHKETRVTSPFMGDGLIVSPPDRNARLTSVRFDDGPLSMIRASAADTSDRDVLDFVVRGARSLGLDPGVFHAEVIVTRDGTPRFVELNPRPAGGLLADTAGWRLGIDLVDAAISLHLSQPILVSPSASCVGQFPIYAHRVGQFLPCSGAVRQRILQLPNVVLFVDNVPTGGLQVSSLEQETYLAFVGLRGATHQEIRAAEENIRPLLRAAYA